MINREIIDVNLINYKSGLNYFSNNADLYEKYIFKFLDDTHFNDAKKAFENNDNEQLLEFVHALKGITGTLAMTKLFEACCGVVNAIRAKEISKIPELFHTLEEVYSTTYNYVKSLS